MKRVLAVAIMLGMLSGCTAASPTWHSVAADGLTPSTLLQFDAGMLVAGARDGGPALDLVNPNGTRDTFDLIAQEPYARTATLTSLVTVNDSIDAIGVQTGGAHGNPRWTVWQGSVTSQQLTSHPQGFFTFGGHDAGPLLGLASWRDRPVIVGSRTTATGSRLVVYSVEGTTWSAPPTSPAAVSSDSSRELGFTAATNAQEYLVITGDELRLAPELKQRPALWLGIDDQHWTQVTLPVPDGGSGLARATGVACEAHRCWVTGWVHGAALAWQVTLAAAGSATTSEPVRLADDASDSVDPSALIALSSGRPVIAVNAVQPIVTIRCSNGRWHNWDSPGPITALQTTAGQVTIISGGQLWEATLPEC